MHLDLDRSLNGIALPDFSDVAQLLNRARVAQNLIAGVIRPSPLKRSSWLSALTGADVWLKLECLNPYGSFKVRGALNALHSKRIALGAQGKDPHDFKVCAASAGNHAQGVAFAAQTMGVESHIFLPTRTPLVKRAQTAALGSQVYLVGEVLQESFQAALAFADQQGATFIHPYNDLDIIMGQSSVALEILEQFPVEAKVSHPPDVVVQSVGGGGLISGCGFVLKNASKAKVVGVEQQRFDSAQRSIRTGRQQDVTQLGGQTIADGIAVQRIGNLNFEFMKRYVDDVLLVGDDDITAAVLGLLENEHVVTEGAGAASVAALLRYPGRFQGQSVVVTVSGGNMDPQLLSRVIARGLGVTGRTLRLVIYLGDRPGQLKSLISEIAALDANILEVFHDRTYSEVTVGEVEVNLALETRDSEHQLLLMKHLEQKGFAPRIWNVRGKE